jgi:hypothetical protein
LGRGDCPLFSKHSAGICLGGLSEFAIQCTHVIQQVFRPASEAGIPAINIFRASVTAAYSENHGVMVIIPEFCLRFIRLFSSFFLFIYLFTVLYLATLLVSESIERQILELLTKYEMERLWKEEGVPYFTVS